MNCYLIYPPIDADVPAKSTLLGLGYLASVLRERGHKVHINDLTLEARRTCFIDIHPYATVCISIMFSDYKKSAFELIRQIKHAFPKTHVIVGGAHASTFPEECMEYADCVVVGEGEEVICDIVENRHRGIVRAERIRNLDSLPMPAWDLMMPDIEEINYLSRRSPFLMRRPLAHIITSRGCPNNCSYCAVKVAWGRWWIPRSASNIVHEMQFLHEEHGINEIHFNDDNCSVNKKRMYELCEEILHRELNIKIACPTGIHVMTLDKPLLKLMKRAGFYRLCFGIETGSPKMQRKIHKNIDLKKAKEVIRDANDLGFWTSATFIFDFPYETKTDIMQTFDFIEESQLDFPVFYNLNMQPKTEIYEQFKSLL